MQQNSMNLKINYRTFIHIVFIIACVVLFLLPLWMVISISLTDESIIIKDGYRIIPKIFTLEAYRYVFDNPKSILDAYVLTFSQAIIGTFAAVIVMALCAYPLSRSNFSLRRPLTFFIFFTMVFNGGLIPSYILNTKLLHLNNSFLIYILPHLCNVFYIIIFRTYFKDLPAALFESAKIDGASELRIFFQIVVPLSKPVFATMALFVLLDKWNDWFTSMIYITKPELYTLQYLLQKIILELEYLKNLTQETPEGLNRMNIPSEGIRYAFAVVAAGPMILVFPFFQKYFVRGLTVGAVKG